VDAHAAQIQQYKPVVVMRDERRPVLQISKITATHSVITETRKPNTTTSTTQLNASRQTGNGHMPSNRSSVGVIQTFKGTRIQLGG